MMKAKRQRELDELEAEAEGRFCKLLGDVPSLTHVGFTKTYGSTAGPFGGIGGHAMTTFDMDAFVCDADKSGEPVELAVVFAAGRFWSIVRWGMNDPIMEPID